MPIARPPKAHMLSQPGSSPSQTHQTPVFPCSKQKGYLRSKCFPSETENFSAAMLLFPRSSHRQSMGAHIYSFEFQRLAERRSNAAIHQQTNACLANPVRVQKPFLVIRENVFSSCSSTSDCKYASHFIGSVGRRVRNIVYFVSSGGNTILAARRRKSRNGYHLSNTIKRQCEIRVS